MDSFLILHQQRQCYEHLRYDKRIVPLSPELILAVLPATDLGIQKAFTLARRGWQAKLLAFKADRPTKATDLLSMCREKLDLGQFKEITTN